MAGVGDGDLAQSDGSENGRIPGSLKVELTGLTDGWMDVGYERQRGIKNDCKTLARARP